MIKMFERQDWSIDHEIIIKFKNGIDNELAGKFDRIGTLSEVYEDDEYLVVINDSGGGYTYFLNDIEKYKIRVYSPEDIYDVGIEK